MKSICTNLEIKKIVVFASGSGSNAENIIRYFSKSNHTEISAVFTNNSNAGVIERCERLKIACSVLSKEKCLNGALLRAELDKIQPNLVVLAGYLLKIPSEVIQLYNIINIHPALLPKYGGKGMYGHHVHEAVIASKDLESGITIHFVNDQYDEGQIIFQASCQIDPSDNANQVAEKVHQLEMTHYPLIIDQVLNG